MRAVTLLHSLCFLLMTNNDVGGIIEAIGTGKNLFIRGSQLWLPVVVNVECGIMPL